MPVCLAPHLASLTVGVLALKLHRIDYDSERKRRMRAVAGFGLTVLVFMVVSLPLLGAAQDKKQPGRSAASRRITPEETELARLRADVIEKIKAARDGAQRLLQLHEEERRKRAEEYDKRRELYHQGLISRTEVNQAEHRLADAMVRVEEDKRWLVESEVALTEASLRDELLRLPNLAIGGYSETGTLVRFNGGASWSLADVPRIKKLFFDTFGRALPISAFGQTLTHDRLRFDHRNAIDVAVHPDSSEGRFLLAQLRREGIPFMAFRNASPGAATGAHIHIGQPSLRSVGAVGSLKATAR